MNIKPKAYAILTISEIHKSEPFPKLISRENENVLVEQFSIFYTIFRIFAGDGLILFPAFPTLSLRRSINDVYSLHFLQLLFFLLLQVWNGLSLLVGFIYGTESQM